MEISGKCTVRFDTTEQAAYVAEKLRIKRQSVDVAGVVVTLDYIAVGMLSVLDDRTDGNFDGGFVWMDGVGYPVRPVT